MKINPKQIEKAMKKMGIQSQDIPANEVIIRTPDKEIVIANPQVSRVNAMGQDTFQIMGDVSERSTEKFSSEDIQTVIDQTGVSEEEAKAALEEFEGDLAQAIMKLKG